MSLYYFIFYFSQVRENIRGWKTNVKDGIRVNELWTIIVRITEIIMDILKTPEITILSLSWSSSGKNIYSHHSICHNVNKKFFNLFLVDTIIYSPSWPSNLLPRWFEILSLYISIQTWIYFWAFIYPIGLFVHQYHTNLM